MKTAEQWLKEYSATHRHPINQKIHTICVPAILFAVLGAAWHLRATEIIWLNGGVLLTLFGLLFYATLGLRPFLLMLVMTLTMNAFVMALAWGTALPTLWVYAAIFILAWIGQFVGHHYEGKSPSFFQDLQFLLIGPLWVFYH